MTTSIPRQYTVNNNHGVVTTVNLATGQEAQVNLPVDASASGQPFAITR
ncbi:MAG TPA: hypothetical protein VG167_14665 [Verrucomicrobiae bacterium]|nr:hypothetical protein [Verrucomicrobiae bacterium]